MPTAIIVILSIGAKIVTNAALGHNNLWLGRVILYLFAESSDCNIHSADIAVILIIPYAFKQALEAKTTVLIDIYKIKFADSEVDKLFVFVKLIPVKIKSEVAY